MEIIKNAGLSSVAALAVALIGQTAQARVALDPQSINLEPFKLVPTLGVEVRQDSNIYSLPSEEVDSMVMVVSPSFRLRAQDRNNTYTANYDIAGGFYSENGDDNYVDHKLNIGAHVEPTGRFRFDLGAGYNMLHDDRGVGYSEGRGLPFILAMSEPDQYALASLNGGIEYGAKEAAGQLSLSLGETQKRYELDDRAADRDLDTTSAALGFRYKAMPKTKFLVDLEYEAGAYQNAGTAASSDYTDARVYGGAIWDSTGSTTGKIRLGVSKRDLESPTQEDLSSPAWDVGVIWSPLEYTRFTLDGSQEITDGTLPTVAIDNTTATVGWNHDVNDRVETRLAYSFTAEDHQRLTGLNRKDDSNTVSASVNYQMRRWLVLGAGMTFRNRNSNYEEFDLIRNVYALNAQISL
ncbi:MAG: outer membrane beta-barrel protein [Moraxellaceae bacterium]|nr:outer membrane beta-barrel protein [Moraxellaceae bacterium]